MTPEEFNAAYIGTFDDMNQDSDVMKDGDRFFLNDEVLTYREPELLESVRLNAKTTKTIKIGDPVTILISGKPTCGTVEEIRKASVESVIKVRLTPTRYTLVNTIHMEYRNYNEKGFFELRIY